MDSTDSSYEKARIEPLKGTENYFSWSRVIKARLYRVDAWISIESEPPFNHGRTKAPSTLERFREQFDQLGLDLDTTRYNRNQWEAAYIDYKEEIKEFNDWTNKQNLALSEIIERVPVHSSNQFIFRTSPVSEPVHSSYQSIRTSPVSILPSPIFVPSPYQSLYQSILCTSPQMLEFSR